MRTAAASTAVGLLALVATTWAAPPTPTPAPAGPAVDPAVANLVKDLGHPDYRTREKAGAALAAKGEKVLPDLRRALAGAGDPEVARRLGVLVRRLDHDRLVSAKRVTLNLKAKTAKDAFAEIEKQTGYRVEFNGSAPDTKLDFVMENVPFWEAMDRVSGAVGMAASFDYGEDVRVFANGSVNPYVSYSGPFRFVATNMQSNRNIQLSNITPGGTVNRGGENIQFQFQIYSEPKNPMLTVGQAEVISAVDEAGASLVLRNTPDRQYYTGRTYYSGYPNGYRSHNQSAGLSLFRADKGSTVVKSLKGKVGITLLAGTVPEVVVPDPVKVKNGKFVGRTVELDVEGVTEAGGNYTAALTIRRVGGNQNDYSWAYNQWQKLELVDAKGLKYRANQQNFNGGGPNGGVAQVTIQFSPTGVRGQTGKPGAPTKLIFQEWVTVTHEVQFEFKDLPLP